MKRHYIDHYHLIIRKILKQIPLSIIGHSESRPTAIVPRHHRRRRRHGRGVGVVKAVVHRVRSTTASSRSHAINYRSALSTAGAPPNRSAPGAVSSSGAASRFLLLHSLDAAKMPSSVGDERRGGQRQLSFDVAKMDPINGQM